MKKDYNRVANNSKISLCESRGKERERVRRERDLLGMKVGEIR
jgi:hypothetical protein